MHFLFGWKYKQIPRCPSPVFCCYELKKETRRSSNVLTWYKRLVSLFPAPQDMECFGCTTDNWLSQSACEVLQGDGSSIIDWWRLDAERACWNVEANGVKNWISLRCVADREENPSHVPDCLRVLERFHFPPSKPLYYLLSVEPSGK
jgi:hypothetical protein